MVAGTELVAVVIIVEELSLEAVVVLGTSLGIPVDVELVVVVAGTSVGIPVGMSTVEDVEVCE